MSSLKVSAGSSPRTTLWCFAGVLGFALPYFIYSKRANEAKKKDRHIALRKSGAFSISGGEKIPFPRPDK